MIMYRLIKYINQYTGCLRLDDSAFIPFDPANTDYQQFKLDITNGAELLDADGNVMTAEQVQAFLETLP